MSAHSSFPSSIPSQTILEIEALPDYVTIKELEEPNPVLRTPAATLTFPLSPLDLQDIQILKTKFEAEENCTGLAAPQIGISKKIIIFAVNDSDLLRKWRPDATQFMPQTIWINPSYKPIGKEMHEDFEACFSVELVAGMVPRYKKIFYEAYTLFGEKVTGEAEGFLARAIQHETDHINGILFTDCATPESIMPLETYRKIRAQKMEIQETIS